MKSAPLAVSVSNLAKVYRISVSETDEPRSPRQPRTRAVEFWALRDVDFTIPSGVACGLLGRNGAGKSTLLKILSRIVEPTTGSAAIYGSLSSMLEVGAGFHPELTGRENVFLNGAVLGMRRSEIQRRFDEIVEFAEIAKFIDVPVKRYSSGMYVRLAFSVSAHLRSDIILVDEVLSVGDAAFQRKCIEKMRSVAADGRTLIVVSHNMAAIQRLCSQCLVFDGGRLVFQGPTLDAVASHLDRITAGSNEAPAVTQHFVTASRLCTAQPGSSRACSRFESNDDIEVQFDFDLTERIEYMYLGCWLSTAEGYVFTSSYDDNLSGPGRTWEPGSYSARMRIEAGFLNAGEYTIRTLAFVPHGDVFFDNRSLFVQVTDEDNSSAQTGWGHRVGAVIAPFRWSLLQPCNKD